MGSAVLLTGRPGVGKTTAIRRIVAALGREAGGFYTQEIRAGGRRQGFKIITLDGREAILAHVTIKGPPRIGQYGVDLAALESVGVGSLYHAIERQALVVIDEIGPMEIRSAAFREAVQAALRSGSPVLGSIMQRPDPFADAIKALPGVTVLEVTRQNRDDMPARILELL